MLSRRFRFPRSPHGGVDDRELSTQICGQDRGANDAIPKQKYQQERNTKDQTLPDHKFKIPHQIIQHCEPHMRLNPEKSQPFDMIQ